MFVRVIDTGQNLNSNEIETVVVTIEASNGDVITLRLYESGPDTGEFFAFYPQRPKRLIQLMASSARAGIRS